MWAICPTRSAGGVPTSAPSSLSFGNTARKAIAPTMLTLLIDLVASASMFGPNTFLAPDIGLIRLGSGLSALNVGFKPTWPAPAAIPATAHTPTTGSTARPTFWPTSTKSEPMPLELTTSGCWMRAITSSIACSIRDMMLGPKADRASRPDIRMAAPLTSAERATWPFLRASSRVLGVAFSVLSFAIALRRPERVQRGQDGLLELVAHEAGDERQRRADQREADDDLGGEADGEDVQLRDDARDHAEAGVRDDQRHDHGRADHEAGHEDAGEGDLRAVHQRADVRRRQQR